MNASNTDMQDLIAQSIRTLLGDISTPDVIRNAEALRTHDSELWGSFVESGFDLALVPESLGGSGLRFSDVGAIPRACGYFAAPVPLSETMLARGLAAAAGKSLPVGSVALGLASEREGQIMAQGVAWGASAEYVLILGVEASVPKAMLLRTSDSQLVPHAGLSPSGETDMIWQGTDALYVWELPEGAEPLRICAAMACIQAAGAMERVLDTSIRYVQERSQFGRPISGFQAIQQQLAVIAEDVFAARMASSWLCDSPWVLPRMEAVPAAKVVISEAAARVSALAHAVHGAMGITLEYELHLFTKRLLRWRGLAGTEAYWSRLVGQQLITAGIFTWEQVRAEQGLTQIV